MQLPKMDVDWNTMLPCTAAMKFLNVDPVNFISFWYKKETYAEVYNSIIYPVNGEQVWERTEMSDVVSPPTKNMPGRPKKKRRLKPWEVMKNKSQLGQTGLKKKCGICHKLGHNRKSCIEKSFEQGASAPRPSHPRPFHLGPPDQGPCQAATSAPRPSQEAPSQAAPTAPPPPSPFTQPKVSQPSQEAPSQATPTAPPSPSPFTQPKVSQPSQAARRTTRSTTKFSKPTRGLSYSP